MSKPIKILFVLILIGELINAQTTGQLSNFNNAPDNGVTDALYQYAIGDISSQKSKSKSLPYGVSGSAYTEPGFLPTRLYYKDEFQGNFYYRYNAYNEEIELKETNIPDAPISALARDKNLSIMVDDKKMSFQTFIDKKGLTQNGYLEKLLSGKYSLYKRTDVKFTEGQKAQNSFVKAIPAKFSKFTEYYLEIEGLSRIDEVDLKNRKLIKLVPDETKEALKTFLKVEKLNIKNEEDLLKTLSYLNK